MKRNIFLILFLLVFVLCSLLLEGTKKTYIRSGKNSFGDILFNIDGPATTTQKAALAAAALRLAGRLQVERKTVRKNVKTEL